MKTVKALLVTDRGRQPALLSADDASSDGLPVLIVEGVAYAAKDLPAGAYLKVDESEMADQAALAGYFLEPHHTVKRRSYKIVGKFVAVMLLVAGAGGSLFWAVQHALALDLLGALGWVGLSLFTGFLGLVWWSYGEEEMLRREAVNRSKGRRLRRWFGSVVRRR